MNNLRQAAQQARSALANARDYIYLLETGEVSWSEEDQLQEIKAAITTLQVALAEPEQEPVAWMDIDDKGQRHGLRYYSDGNREEVPLYTAPTPRKPLHDMAVFDLADEHLYEGGKNYGILAFARAIERAHGIGEQT